MNRRASHTIDEGRVASDLREVLGRLVRRLRTQNRFPLMHATVLGRLDRGGPQSVSQLAASERVRPQSMAQTVAELETGGLVRREPDPHDGRRALVELTAQGRTTLGADRRHREGWLAQGIGQLDPADQALLRDAVEVLRRLADAEDPPG